MKITLKVKTLDVLEVAQGQRVGKNKYIKSEAPFDILNTVVLVAMINNLIISRNMAIA